MKRDPAPIFRDAWMLTEWVLARYRGSPDPVAVRACAAALDLLQALTAALHGSARADKVEAADDTLAWLRVLLRLSMRDGILDERQLMHGLGLADAVGRQLGGWRRSLGAL